MEGQPDEQLLTFRVDGTGFAVPANAVREVVRRPRVTRVPHAPPSLLGLGNLRGTVLPLVSLAALIDRPVTADGRIIVLDRADPVGILVDEVSAMVRGGSDDANDVQLIDLTALLVKAFGIAKPAALKARIGSVEALTAKAKAVDEVALLSFSVGAQEYALPLEQIDEVTRLPDDITLLPKADAVVVGTIARQDRLLPLLSLQLLLGLRKEENDQVPRVVIVRIGAQCVGLVVDTINSILRVDESAIDPVPVVLSRGASEARIQAICRLDGGARLVSILAADHLLRDDLTSHLVQKAESQGDQMADAAQGSHTEQFLVFLLGEQTFGLPIAAVTEVAMLPAKLTKLPNAPAFIEGVMSLRGQAVPVIDQRLRFLGDAASGRQRRVVIVAVGATQTGFVVDAVSGVLRVPLSELRPAPKLGVDSTRVFDRVVNTEDGIVLVVDPSELLNRAERDTLTAMSRKSA